MAFDLDDEQAELGTAISVAEHLLDSLRQAESCESNYDYRANVADAKASCTTLLDELRERLAALGGP